MSADRFVEALNAQIGNELAAHNQYLACAVHYDADLDPVLLSGHRDAADTTRQMA